MKILSKIKNGLLKFNIIHAPDPQGLATRLYKNYNKIDKSPRTAEELLKTMNRGVTVLEELGVKYSVGRGTLLGHHRDKKFLPRDNDIDIDVFSDHQIYAIINKMPFELLLITISVGRYQQLVFIDPETGVLFDIWFYHLINNQFTSKHAVGLFMLPKKSLKNLTYIRVNDRNYSSHEMEWYCTYWYGKNWKTPSIYSEDWLSFYKRDCAGFEFKPEDHEQYINLYE